MIVTTTPSVEGRRITEYKGVVFGEVIAGVNFVKDFVAGLSNFFGGRSGTYEEELINARQQALDEMEQRGSIGPHEGANPRAVLISRHQWLELQMNQPDES